MDNSEDDLGRLKVLALFSDACARGEWGEARVLFAFIRVHYYNDAEEILKQMDDEHRKMFGQY